MLNTIIQNLKTEYSEKLKTNFGIATASAEELTQTSTKTLVDNLKKQVLSGKLNAIISLLSGKTELNMENPIAASLAADLKQAFVEKEPKLSEVSNFTVIFLLGRLSEEFIKSGCSADADGVAQFIGMDKNVLKAVSGGLGGMFGKIFG